MRQNEHPPSLQGVPNKDIKMAALSLTEEMFSIIQGYSYVESMKYISPGSGLPEGMFSSLEYAQHYELDTRLTYKGYQRKKGGKRKTTINPTMIYTMFSVFAEDSPQQVRRNMVEWINDNKEKFEHKTLLAFTAKDSDLDTWLSTIDNNCTPGDEFALFALCQMYSRHALIATSSQIWTSVHPKHELDNNELRRKCDLHLIYLGGNSFGILKPKFEWKTEVPLGHIEMIEPPNKTLQDRTDEILSKEAKADNAGEIKVEPVNTQLPDVTGTSTSSEPLDATRNLLVALPPDMELNLDIGTPLFPTEPNPKVTPCCVKLTRCDTDTITPTTEMTESHVEVNVVVNNPSYELRPKTSTSNNKATSTMRSRRPATRNISYVNLFHDSSSDDTSGEGIVQPVGAVTKREPSHYRLAAHKYMLARKRGILPGPRVCTRASVVPKKDKPDPTDSDSDATVILDNNNNSPVPAKTKTTGRNRIRNKRKTQKTFVTKTYVLRKGGLPRRARNKRKNLYVFKCLKCSLRWATCKERNDHFKRNHRKLQCEKCKKFFRTPSAFGLHKYIHRDGQFECKVCRAHFPFKSQLKHHMVSHRETRDYKCLEPFCEKKFTHKSDLVKHERTHSGVMYKCGKCDYSNSNERNYNQHLRRHTDATPFQCKQCGERFKYTMQLKRHRENPDNTCS